MAAYKVDQSLARHIYNTAVSYNPNLEVCHFSVSFGHEAAAILGNRREMWIPIRVFITNEELVAWRLTS